MTSRLAGRRVALPIRLLALATQAVAHNLTEGDAVYIQEIWGCVSSPSCTSAPSTR